MKRFSQQFKKQATHIRLTATEQDTLRERVISYMEYHPMQSGVAPRVQDIVVGGERYRTLPFSLKQLFQWSAAAGVMIILVIPLLAERSVPGDALYAVKIKVTEELRASLAQNHYERVVWETERLNRRIAEARLLASEGRLSETVEAEVAAAVRVHGEAARQGITALEQINTDEAAIASIQLETALEVQSTSLRENDSASTTVGQSTSLIADAVSDTHQNAMDTAPTMIPSYDRLLAQVEQNTTRAYELLATISTDARPEDATDVKRRLSDIERAIREVMSLGSQDVQAIEKLTDVLQRTERLIVYMSDVGVRNVPLESVVPVVLTTEERTLKVQETIDLATKNYSQLKVLITAEKDDAAVLEKITLAASEGLANLNTASSSLAAGNLVEAETAATTASALLADALLLAKPVAASDALNATTTASSTPDAVATSTIEQGEIQATSTEVQQASSSPEEVPA